ncbi:hypothetical protein BGX30_008628, partial [Mortierella sp. GBA39]
SKGQQLILTMTLVTRVLRQRHNHTSALTRRTTLTMVRFDVGAAFRRLEEEAAPFINDESVKVLVKKLYLML